MLTVGWNFVIWRSYSGFLTWFASSDLETYVSDGNLKNIGSLVPECDIAFFGGTLN